MSAAIVGNATTGHVSNPGVGSANALLFGAFLPVLAPDPPLLAASGSPGKVSLSWFVPFDEGSPITQYAIYRGTGPGGEGGSPIAVVGGGSTNYDDLTVVNGTTYYYQVAAVNGVGLTRSTERSAIPFQPPPDAPRWR